MTAPLLLFCSYDVGGFPFTFADVLNRNGMPTLFACSSRRDGTDGAAFHRGDTRAPWNLSADFDGPLLTRHARARRLRRLVAARGITRCFATGTDLGELHDAGVPYIYWSYGNDLDACRWPEPPAYPSSPAATARFLARSLRAVPRVARARAALGRADSVMISPFQEATFRSIFGDKRLFWFPHLVPVDSLERTLEEKRKASEELRQELGASRVFFSSTRQYWSRQKLAVMDDKGNDVILRAFARLRRLEPSLSCKLLLIDKGPSVAASRELAAELGVADDVVFRREVPRPQLTRYYAGADVCFGQFGTPVLSFATLEPLALATPAVTFIETGTTSVPTFAELPPLFVSRDPDAIASFLRDVCRDDLGLRDLGVRSWDWARRNCSERSFADAIERAFSLPRSTASEAQSAKVGTV